MKWRNLTGRVCAWIPLAVCIPVTIVATDVQILDPNSNVKGPVTGEALIRAISPTVQPPPFPGNQFVSVWFLQVVKLCRAGIDRGVTLAFIANTAGTFNLSSDQIIYLNHTGVSEELIKAMIEHDQLIAAGLVSIAASQVSLPTVLLDLAITATTSAPTVLKPVTHSDHSSIQSTLPSLTHSNLTPLPPPSSSPSSSTPSVEFRPTIIVRSQDLEPDWSLLLKDEEQAPEQPDCLYRVRLPYAVKLTDPIIVLHYRGY
jgi:hypothetical protein